LTRAQEQYAQALAQVVYSLATQSTIQTTGISYTLMNNAFNQSVDQALAFGKPIFLTMAVVFMVCLLVALGFHLAMNAQSDIILFNKNEGEL
jgi:hypothetical protein